MTRDVERNYPIPEFVAKLRRLADALEPGAMTPVTSAMTPGTAVTRSATGATRRRTAAMTEGTDETWRPRIGTATPTTVTGGARS